MSGGISDVCVVMAAYNAQDTIARAIRSAITQDEVSKIIVVDDASSDGTAAIAASTGGGSEKLEVVRLSKNVGPAAARNLALARSDHAYVAILDADDEFLDGRFRNITAGEWDLLGDDILFLPPAAEPSVEPDGAADPLPRSRALDFAEFVTSNIGDPQDSKPELGFLKPVLRRQMLDHLGLRYDETLRLGEDYLLYAKALGGGARGALIDRIGYLAHVSTNSLSWRHETRDLVALEAADGRLIEWLQPRGAPDAAIDLVRRHRAQLHRKIASRMFLEDKRRLGMARAVLGGLARPHQFAKIASDILRDRRHHRTAPGQVRRLLVDHFPQTADGR